MPDEFEVGRVLIEDGEEAVAPPHLEGLSADVLTLLRLKGVRKADTYAPFFLASIGSHIVNLRNRGDAAAQDDSDNAHPLMMRHGLAPDLRSHLLMVAPPGWGKTFYIRQFTDARFGVLPPDIPHLNATWVTEAGLVGSWGQKKEGESVRVEGDGEIYASGIYACDELSSLLESGPEFNTYLRNVLLQILDDGHVYKRMLGGEIDTWNRITFWGGTQPMRVSLEHGLARRVVIMRLSPTADDVAEFRDERAEGDDPDRVLAYADSLRGIRDKVRHLLTMRFDGIAFHADYGEWRASLVGRDITDTQYVTHQDMLWIDRLAVGWAAVNSRLDSEGALIVRADDAFRDMVRRALQWRFSVLVKGVAADVVRLMEDGRAYTQTQLLALFNREGIGSVEALKTVKDMLAANALSQARGQFQVNPIAREGDIFAE